MFWLNQSATFRPNYRNTVGDIYNCILGMRSQNSRDKNTYIVLS